MRIGLLHDGVVALTWEVDGAPLHLGRASANDLVLPHRDVSGHHAVLHVREGRLWVTDLRSANGTFVGEQRIDEPTALAIGDRIRLGAQATLTVLDDAAVTSALLVERVDGLAAWPVTAVGVPLPGADAVVLQIDGEVWLMSDAGDDQRLALGDTFDVGGTTYRVAAAREAGTTERLDVPPPLVLHVDLPGEQAVLTGGAQRAQFTSEQRVALLHALGARWLADGGAADGGWMDDAELAVAVWGRRHREHGANNLNVLVHRVRSEAAAAGLGRTFLQKRSGRTRLQLHKVEVE